MTHSDTGRPAPRGAGWRRAATVTAAAALAAALGCSSLLDVDNPNNVNAKDLGDPASAAAQVNGILAALTRGASQLIGHVETASDDMTWIGSLDGVDRLNRGFVRDPFNEFLEDAAFGMTPARFTGNRTIKQLEQFRSDSTLTDVTQLALANLYTAIVYDYIANHYDDFVIASNQREAGPAIGPANMVSLYDSAEAATTRGLDLAPAASTALRGQLFAIRARAKFDREIWKKLNPSGKTPAQPLVDAQGAADDAAAALPSSVRTPAFASRCRREWVSGTASCRAAPTAPRDSLQPRDRDVQLHDARAHRGAPRPDLGAARPASDHAHHRVRERDDPVARHRDGLPRHAPHPGRGRAGEGADVNVSDAHQPVARAERPAGVDGRGRPALGARHAEARAAGELLPAKGRRLNDMYRFGIVDPEWVAGSDAVTCPGSMFPINNSERLANTNVASWQPACGQ